MNVTVEALTKRYGRRVVLDDISLSVGSREFVCVVGYSGSGKSTLLHCIAGLEEFDGSIKVDGQEISASSDHCGVVFQEYALFPWLTVERNISFGIRMSDAATRKAGRSQGRVDWLISMIGLDEARNFYPHQLSGGMRQRVAIARSLATDPPLILMDEPFGALDALTRARLQRELLRIWELTQKTIIFVTHSTSEAVILADRIFVIDDGGLQSIHPVTLRRPRMLSDPLVGESIATLDATLAGLGHERLALPEDV